MRIEPVDRLKGIIAWHALASAFSSWPFLALLSLDGLFIGLHLLRSASIEYFPAWQLFHDSAFALDIETGYAETYQPIKIALTAALLLHAGVRTRAPVLSGLGIAFLYLALDDAFELHERAGAYIERATDFRISGDAGELVYLAGALVILGAVVTVAAMRSTPAQNRTAAALFAVPLIAFGIFGGGGDLLHAIAGGWFRGINTLLTVFEDGGELIAMSMAFAVAWMLAKQSSAIPAEEREAVAGLNKT